MNTIFHKIATVVIGGLMTVSSLFGFNHQSVQQPNLGALAPQFTAAKPTYLYGGGISSSDTSIKLTALVTPNGTAITTAQLVASVSNVFYATVEPSTNKKETISCTGVTQNGDGTALITGCTRGLQFTYPYTASSTLAIGHSGGSSVVLSNSPQVYNDIINFASSTYVDFASTQTVTGTKTFSGTTTLSGITAISGASTITSPNISNPTVSGTLAGSITLSGVNTISGVNTFSAKPIFSVGATGITPTGTTDVAIKSYVDGVAIAGGAIASNSLTGISRVASSSQIQTGYSSTTAYLIPSSLASSVASTTASVVVVSSSTTGLIDPSFLPAAVSSSKFGGTGTDGALIATSTTVTINLNGSSTVVKNYTSISITGTGKIAFSNPHANGSTVVFKSQGAVTLTSSQAPMVDMSQMGADGGATTTVTNTVAAGNPGSIGLSYSYFKSNFGTGGVNLSTPGNGGAVPVSNTLQSPIQIIGKYPSVLVGAGGGSGHISIGSGGNASSGSGGKGGGALIIECAGAWNFTTTNGISVAGQNGGNGTTANAGNSNVGGGGGGGGGLFMAFYNSLTANTGTVTISGGTGGNGVGGGGSGAGGGGGGSIINAGSNGSVSAGGKNGGDGAVGYSLVTLNTEF